MKSSLFSKGSKLFVGMVHLLPLPGSPGYGGSFEAIVTRALKDGLALQEGGADAVIMENYGDVPFFSDSVPPETVAAMAVIARAIRAEVSLPMGINVLRNDARSALAVALAAGGNFIRVNVHSGAMVTDQGIVQGKAAETMRARVSLKAPVAVWADVMVKHSAPLGDYSIEGAAKDTAYRGLADALIVSGAGTGQATELAKVKRVRSAVPDLPILIGSGTTPENLAEFLPFVDGFIVGTALKEKGITVNPVSLPRVKAFARALRPKSR
jgi:hypothetical protein